MNTIILMAADLAAISVLTLALYLRRHRRRDLVVSYLGMNVGVLAVATALSGSAAGVGLGLGSSVCSRSSVSAPRSSPSTRWPTTSPPWPWA